MEDRCISCGAIVPEGTMVCPQCMYESEKVKITKRSRIRLRFSYEKGKLL